MEQQVESLRERTRRVVRGEIVETAMDLFVARGFEVTTVEEIALAAGISRRSYFRYFSSKEDVLNEGLAAVGRVIADALASRPPNEGAWRALRRSFDPLIQQVDADPRTEALGRLMLENPGARHDKETTWVAVISSVLAPRIESGNEKVGIDAEALAASAVACLHVSHRRWLDGGQPTTLGALLDAAMSAVSPLT